MTRPSSNVIVSIACFFIAGFFLWVGDHRMMTLAAAVGSLAALAEVIDAHSQ